MNLFFNNLDWILGISSLLGQLLLIKKLWWAPIFGLSLQALWYTFAIQRGEYGLLPSTTGFTILYVYGIFKWTKEKRMQKEALCRMRIMKKGA